MNPPTLPAETDTENFMKWLRRKHMKRLSDPVELTEQEFRRMLIEELFILQDTLWNIEIDLSFMDK